MESAAAAGRFSSGAHPEGSEAAGTPIVVDENLEPAVASGTAAEACARDTAACCNAMGIVCISIGSAGRAAWQGLPQEL